MKLVVMGGGIAGACCVDELCRLSSQDEVCLVSASTVLKGIDKVVKITRTIEEFQVVERDLSSLTYPNLTVVHGVAKQLNTRTKELTLASGEQVSYDKLCICAGARPKCIPGSQHVFTLRDTESIQELAGKLQSARRLVLVGNGGIALELVGAVSGPEVVWVLKHSHIGDAFFDVDAANFLLTQLQQQQQQQQCKQSVEGMTDALSTRPAEEADITAPVASAPGQSHLVPQQHKDKFTLGHAAGPNWTDRLPPHSNPSHVTLEYSSQVQQVTDLRPAQYDDREGDWPVYVELQSGKIYGADLVVAAVGVEPCSGWLGEEFERAGDGGLLVDRSMQTSVQDVYAAGDCCTIGWADECPHWFQMRLWTQARIMGMFAAHNIDELADELGLGFNFELFTHVTRFLGKKVVLLGLYNGQGLEHEPEQDIVMYSRVTDAPDATFVRVLLLRGRMQGAILIGETGLEEAFEHLILDQLDLSTLGPEILDPDIELEHMFD